MAQKKTVSEKKKISPEFAARLEHLGPREEVRAIVLVRTGGAQGPTAASQSREGRKAAAEATQRSAEQALDEIDGILARFHGERLARHPDALGSLPVETTAAGIRALASSRWVKAILEDQPIHLIS
jgi:hypothetical protein